MIGVGHLATTHNSRNAKLYLDEIAMRKRLHKDALRSWDMLIDRVLARGRRLLARRSARHERSDPARAHDGRRGDRRAPGRRSTSVVRPAAGSRTIGRGTGTDQFWADIRRPR